LTFSDQAGADRDRSHGKNRTDHMIGNQKRIHDAELLKAVGSQKRPDNNVVDQRTQGRSQFRNQKDQEI